MQDAAMHYLWVSVIGVYLLTRYGEYRIHKINYDFLVFAGGEELNLPALRWMYRLGILVIPAAGFEYLLKMNRNINIYAPFWLQAVAVAAVLIGLHLRQWTMRELGHRWSMRCVFVSGYPRAVEGPFMWFRHPEYLSRLLEGVGLALFGGSFISAAVFSMVFIRLWSQVVRVENAQLLALSIDSPETTV